MRTDSLLTWLMGNTAEERRGRPRTHLGAQSKGYKMQEVRTGTGGPGQGRRRGQGGTILGINMFFFFLQERTKAMNQSYLCAWDPGGGQSHATLLFPEGHFPLGWLQTDY